MTSRYRFTVAVAMTDRSRASAVECLAPGTEPRPQLQRLPATAAAADGCAGHIVAMTTAPKQFIYLIIVARRQLKFTQHSCFFVPSRFSAFSLCTSVFLRLILRDYIDTCLKLSCEMK